MSETEEHSGKTIGKVIWGFQSSGYISGLSEIEGKLFEDTRVYFFAREVALSVLRPIAAQKDPRIIANDLITDGILTQNEISYIYSQFGYNPNTH